MNSPFPALAPFFSEHQRFIVLSHIRPDGDAYGSTLGLGLCLRALGKEVRMYNEEGLSPRFRFLPGSDGLVKTPPEAPDASWQIIAVDTSELSRLGKTFVGWNRVPDLNLDHHVSNPSYGARNCIAPRCPATAELLHEMMVALGFPCPPEVAANLFVGLSTDTGSFRHRGTTARSFEIAAELVRAGADANALAQECYNSFPPERLLLLRETLNDMQFAFDHRVSWFHIYLDMYRRTGAQPEDTEGLIEFLQMTRTVEVAFIFEEIDAQTTRVSLRSRGTVDVQKIASALGGGGHRLAAGIRSTLPLAELEKTLLRAAEGALPPRPPSLSSAPR